MKGLLLILLGIFLPFSIFSQYDIRSIIVDSEGQSIPYCNVYVINSNRGALSDIDGNFVVPNANLGDSLIISRLGYTSKKLMVKATGLADTIILIRTDYSLNEIMVISSKLNDLPIYNIGRNERKTNHYYKGKSYFNYQIGSRLKNPSKKNGILKSIEIYIGSLAKNKFPFRINIYEYDNSCLCPGEQINNREIIFQKTKKGWNKVKLDEAIDFPVDGLFVSYEWLATDGNNSNESYRHWLGIVTSKEDNYTFEKIGGGNWRKHIMSNNNFHLLFRGEALLDM